ncbi:MAG TPA: hypothetical protein O0X39_06805 [Methanocorpusculum sp.]|nr:hypothetical protein [Methanocorpusculum sp.]
MPDDIDLFADAPPLKRCDGCGQYFEEQELKKCRICGQYFCPECRKTHDCRIKSDTGVHTSSVPAVPAPAAERPYVRPPESPAPIPVYAASEEPARTSSQALCQEPVPCTEPVYVAPEIPLNDGEATENAAEPAHNPDELQCSECKQWFPKSMLSQCHKCGAIVCRDCRTKHKCPSKKKAKKQDEDFAEPNLANEKRQKKEKSRKSAEDDYDSIMNFQESKKKRSSGKNKKKIILFICIGIAAVALIFVLLNVFGFLSIIPGISGLIPLAAGESPAGDWFGDQPESQVRFKEDGTGAIVGPEHFLGISSTGYSPFKWAYDGKGNYAITDRGASSLAIGPLRVSGGILQLTMQNDEVISLHR